MKIEKKITNASIAMKAISDSTRLAIVLMLMKKDVYVKEIIKRYKIEPTLLSHHLNVLKKSGIITSKRIGKTVLYTIVPNIKTKGEKGLLLNGCKVIFPS